MNTSHAPPRGPKPTAVRSLGQYTYVPKMSHNNIKSQKIKPMDILGFLRRMPEALLDRGLVFRGFIFRGFG